MTTTIEIMAQAAQCPSWCTDHTGFDDGSEDWHQSGEVAVSEFDFYVSTGTLSGGPEIFFPRTPDEGISLDSAETFARSILAMIEEARA